MRRVRVLSGCNTCEAFLAAIGAVGAVGMAVGSGCFFGGRTHAGRLMWMLICGKEEVRGSKRVGLVEDGRYLIAEIGESTLEDKNLLQRVMMKAQA